MVEADNAASPPKGRVTKLIGRQTEKLVEHFWAWLLAPGAGFAALVWAWKKRALFTEAVWSTRIPLLFFLLLSIPAAFGIYAFTRRYLRRSPLYVTPHPQQSFCSQGGWGDMPSLAFRLQATFTNVSESDVLLMYAYARGTKPLTHFMEPVSIPPKTALINEDVYFVCTFPRRPPKSPYRATFVFVDAGGLRFRQKLVLRYLPAPQPAPSKPIAAPADLGPSTGPKP